MNEAFLSWLFLIVCPAGLSSSPAKSDPFAMDPFQSTFPSSKVSVIVIERFSFECRKVLGFAFTTQRDWFKKLAPLFHPIRSKTKTNRDSLARVFPHFASATCNYFVFWLVHLIIWVLCDWLEWLLWFWFCDTQLKTALCKEFCELSFNWGKAGITISATGSADVCCYLGIVPRVLHYN